MTDRSPSYKAIYDTAEFTTEFIAAQAKRLTKLYLRRRELDDELPTITFRINPLVYLLPLFGAVIGGLIGAML